MKSCSMCGGEKSLEEFRKYPNGKSYPYCLECQTIETRRRYLLKLENGYQGLSQESQAELDSINKLYDKRLEKGLKTFGGKSRAVSVRAIVDKQMKSLE